MKKIFIYVVVLVICITALLQLFGSIAVAQSTISTNNDSDKVAVVILFVPEANTNTEKEAIRSISGEIKREYKIINAVAARIPSARIQQLKQRKNVLSSCYEIT
jgi:uncharacterized alpha/beta hydrolase family protein